MKTPAEQRFDASYYSRFYVHKATRAMSRAETERRATTVASIVSQLEIPVSRVLDMGCGLGWFKRPLLKAFPKASYVGVEYSEYLCSRHGWTRGSAVDYRGRGQFDLVICCDVLQYLNAQDTARALANLARLCRGALYMHVPTKKDWQTVIDPAGTDAQVFVRSGAWYQRQLKQHFTHLGWGVYLPYRVPFLQWELQAPWR